MRLTATHAATPAMTPALHPIKPRNTIKHINFIKNILGMKYASKMKHIVAQLQTIALGVICSVQNKRKVS